MLAEMDRTPNVIFTTAYDEYALKAFEVNALDYLLKPIEPKRLADAIQKLQNHEDREDHGAIPMNFNRSVLQENDQIEKGEFRYDFSKGLNHTHEGSIGNLKNDAIIEEMNKVLQKF